MKYLVLNMMLCMVWMNLHAQSDSIARVQESDWQLNGYIKNLNGLIFLPDDKSMQWGLIHNRINTKWSPEPWITGAADLRIRLLYGEAVKSGLYPSTILDNDSGLVDLSYLPFDSKSAKMISTVERLWAGVSSDRFLLTIGRQRINWGVNLVWNPNDIFNTYSFIDFDYEERPGSDAIRLEMNTGDLTKIELVAKPGKYKNDDIYAFRYKTNMAGYDIQLLGGWYRHNTMVGAGWTGSIAEVGFKGECSYLRKGGKHADKPSVLSLTTELDYTFSGKYYINASYLYNSVGAGQTNTSTPELLSSEYFISADNLSPARHSAFLQIRSFSSPLVSAGFSAMYLFGINGLYLFPTISYSIDDHWEIAGYIQAYWQEENTFNNKLTNAIIRFKYSF